ncbi:MAG TPA: hypothetical protein PK867_12865, partial [Pirellulales bacterium]|nr:hypothetical protein [Pirellulales bacterium]
MSSKPTFDSSAVYLSSVGLNVSNYGQVQGTLGDLAAGGSYNASGQVTLPQFATGSAYLLVVTNYYPYSYTYGYGTPVALQPESDRTSAAPGANDVFAVPITLVAPDLKTTGASAPATAIGLIIGRTINALGATSISVA